MNGKNNLSRLFYLFNILSLCFNLLKLILNTYTILLGRLGFGICCGVLNQCLTKFINDTVPFSVAQVYGQAVNVGITLGVTVIAFISTNIIPLEENGKAGLQADENWRIVFSYSIVINVISILLIAIKF